MAWRARALRESHERVLAELDLPPAEGLLHTRDLAQVMDSMIASATTTAADIRALPSVAGAVRLIATSINQLPVRLASGGDAPTWLARPRTYGGSLDLADLIQYVVDAMIVHGRGFLLATCVAEGDAPSFRLDAVDPDYVQARVRTDGIVGVEWLLAGNPVPVVPAQLRDCVKGRGYLVHIPYRVSVEHPEGSTPLVECAYMLRGHVSIEKYAAELFENGTHVGGVLTTTHDITAAQAEQWQTAWAAARAARKVAVLGNGLEYRNELADPNELQLVEARSFNQSVVWSLLGIPLSYMGSSLMGGQSSLSYANAQDNDRLFARNCLRAFTIQIAESVSRLLPNGRNPSESQRIEFDYTQWEGVTDAESDDAAAVAESA